MNRNAKSSSFTDTLSYNQMLLLAKYVVPVDAPVIENGYVQIEQGRIVSLGKSADRPFDKDSIDYGQAVICPGFVNAHTHLELTSLKGKVPPTADFPAWILQLVKLIHAELSTKEQLQASTQLGIEQSLAAGVTCVGDITRAPSWSRPCLANSNICGVSFGEIIATGKLRDQWNDKMLASITPIPDTSRIQVGLSPHAPYTVEPKALRECAEKSSALDLPLCIHVAETMAEAQFTQHQCGPLQQYLADLGIWDDEVETLSLTPIDLAEATGLLNARTIIAHANYVSDADINKLATSKTSVAYCPRTHEAFGHEPHLYRDMMSAGVNVAIGTDSLASNPSLSILEELQLLRQRDGIDAQMLMEMGTINGAKALGLGDQVGSLTPGKSADVAVVSLSNSQECHWGDMFRDEPSPVAVYADGKAINIKK